MNDVVVAWKKGVWGKNRIYPEIDSKVFLGLIRLFDTDKNEQIFVHREGEKVYYVYLWRLSKFDYISLGLLTNKLCLDYYDLLMTFRIFVKDMAVNELCVYNTKCGKIKLSSHNIQKQPRQRTLLDIEIKDLKALLDENVKKWSNLPSQKLGILKSDIVPCILGIQRSSWIVTQVTSGYRNVCISIRDKNKPLNKDRRSKESGIASIVNFLQFLPNLSNSGKTAKTLKSLNTNKREQRKERREKHTDWSEVFAASVIGGGIISVLLSCIAPWFISTMQMWLKNALFGTSCLGVYLVIYATDDNHKGKYVSFAGWSGVVAIFLSTVFAIYGLCGGFAPDTVDEGNMQTVTENKKEATIDNTLIKSSHTASKKITSINSASNSVSKPSIPSNYILVAGGHLSYKDTYYEDYKKHNVDIDSFYISVYELTQGEYERVMGGLRKFNYQWLFYKGLIYNEVKGENIPVRGSLRDFAEYCNKRSTQEGFDGFYIITKNSVKFKENGNGYRLVTPYEWIYAAYGGRKNIKQKYLGGKSLSEVAWHLGNSNSKPHSVGLKKPNVIGIFDMQGNAPEILQGDNKYKYYVSTIGGYNISNWNYEQAYDIRDIWASKEEADLLEWTYGTRIVFIPKGVNNKNLKRSYKF